MEPIQLQSKIFSFLTNILMLFGFICFFQTILEILHPTLVIKISYVSIAIFDTSHEILFFVKAQEQQVETVVGHNASVI